MPGLTQQPLLYARAVRRVLRSFRPDPRRIIARPDGRLVFVFGCPRSGTTFLAGALGRLTGYVDLGEVAPLKAAIPTLAEREPADAAPDLRRILTRVQRLGLTGGLRALEQTPESVFIAPALRLAFPEAIMLHLVRDGRDVVCSLRERGWLASSRAGHDDAGHAYGAGTRFWVEPDRATEFTSVSEVRRAAWAWRRYVETGLALRADATELRYELLTSDPGGVAAGLALLLEHPVDELERVLSAAHPESVGRYRSELSGADLAEIDAEAASLLRSLGYG